MFPGMKNGYVQYRVDTHDPDSGGTHRSVRRRFRDFVVGLGCLCRGLNCRSQWTRMSRAAAARTALCAAAAATEWYACLHLKRTTVLHRLFVLA